MSALKRIFLGRPLASEDLGHTLLPKILALPVFASDALSSVAYATEEILHVLILAGTVAAPTRTFGVSMPIAIAVSTLMTIVIVSYRQTVKAYPSGGGAYIVTRENLGDLPGLIAAGALLVDYILTVAVSIAAGAFAVASLAPYLNDSRVAMSLAFIAFITIMNLRGTKESGALFAVPTYFFVVSVLIMLVIGIAKCGLGTCPQSDTVPFLERSGELGLFLILRAFASGATALTGVEAIANGVPAFQGRRPADQARNAATTLALLGGLAITMFIGITYLAHATGAVPSEHKSVLAQIADAAFGGGVGFIAVQIATALILIMAANTAYQDFPRLASILAKDRFLPRQFINRGDRLVFSNGVVMLAVAASALIVGYHADVSRLIQLYVLGVFTSFTLSQTGMVLRWRRLRPEGWRRNAIMNGVGAVTTALVFCVVLITKAPHGAWIVVVAVILLVLLFRAIHRHYASVAAQLRRPEERPARAGGTRAIVLVARLDAAAMRAVGYAIAMRPLEVRAIHIAQGEDGHALAAAWEARRLTVPLTVVAGKGNDLVEPVRTAIEDIRRSPDEFVSIIVPEAYARAGRRQLLSRRSTLLLKAALLFERRVVVTDLPTIGAAALAERGAIAPTRITAVVLVSAVHNATLRALEYARSLSPTDLRAVMFNVDAEDTDRVLHDWIDNVDDIPLEAVDSPYREVTKPVLAYARRLREGRPDLVVSIIVPEFVVRRWWHQPLHNQTALAIKYAVMFEPNVLLTSVPFHLK